MNFNIKQKGYFISLCSENGIYLRVDTSILSLKTVERYSQYIKGNMLEFSSSLQYFLSKSSSFIDMKSTHDNVLPENISKSELQSAIMNLTKQSIIYTGAGISQAAGIKTCEELYDALYINKEINELVETYIENYDYIIAQYRMFCIRLNIAKPTLAHMAISKIVSNTGCLIVTENFDYLHQQSGVFPKNPFECFDELKLLTPDKVFLFGIGCPMCSALFDYWYKSGAVFYSINSKYHELNVPLRLSIEDIQVFFEKSEI